MKKTKTRALKDFERRSTDEAVRRLMDGDLDGSMHAFEQAELAKGLVDHIYDASWRSRLLPVAVAILC
ncbi:MAG: hypothetical protein AAF449_01460, partial [Myxococcota bacterium]